MNSNAKQRLLIVDDELAILRLVGEILEDEGYNIVTAENAQQAREKLIPQVS